MSIPLLDYKPTSQNSRVEGYEVGRDDQPRIYSTESLLSPSAMGELIDAAYRQIFFYAFKSDREPFLESQLRDGQITVRDFIRGLLLSETYDNSFYSKNNNYRFVEQCVQRVLGRDVYNEREKIAWSIVIGTKGKEGFIDELLGSEEYIENFGYDIVPYQRRRVLPSRDEGERPFNITSPRYDGYYRAILGFPQIIWQSEVRRYIPQEKKSTAGNPALYLDMARSLPNRANTPSRVSAMNISLDKVPYRKTTGR
ncbi:Phycobilisome rod-core linker polypeptide CpcG [Hyella patelloides LEGE 07179]|uniref:Phycobilisome rod-core linker polypeptide CpcG n=1 Tax=Hyella patelloides LEGE 07179 TaxID=945734 RepID=A0A563VSC1_9CYAN|nr:phycobilisome rod-core linker polypeptide [Hyella patelloides]VEP14348.1 Phycobilisome rod-core linker polypeptide CpcG [Hyella patelloides LEGE 07179]